MKKYLLTIIALFLLTGCGAKAEPKDSLVAQVGSAQVEGDDVYFEYNGEYRVAKGQSKNFEAIEGPLMIVIRMSDGSYIIQKSDKDVAYQNGYDPEAAREMAEEAKQIQADEKEMDKQRQQELEDARIEYLRSKELSKQDLAQAKLDLKAEQQAGQLQNSTDYLQAQIEKLRAETQKIKNEL